MLLDAVNLGSRTLRNRIVFGPHETNLCSRRALGDRHVDYYRRRAAGGAGLIVTEIASVHPWDWPYERCPLATDAVAGWTAISAACHADGAAVVAGLGHAGMQGQSAFSQREVWGPSPVPDAITRELPKQMEPEDIREVIDGFAEAASLAMAAGMDGVEVNAGQHSLVRQFLSGLTNMRDDEWGPGEDGSGRLRFAEHVLEAVRARVGDGIVGLRLSCDELAPWAGLTPESAADVARALAPHLDYLVVVRGSIFSVDATRPDTHVPAGFNLDLAPVIRDAVAGACLVVAQGSIVDPGQAEWALGEGRADLVEMTRAQIADPDLVRKLTGDVAGAVRPCLLCNQKCRVRDNRNPVVTCVVNPSAGHESVDPERPVHAGTGSLVVVGAGPSGLETARVAAEAGLSVTVIERGDEPCQVVRDLSTAAGRAPMAAIADWLVAECDRLGVRVELGREATASDVAAWLRAGDTVVLATGSRPRPLDAVEAGGTIVRAEDLLAALRRGDSSLPEGPVLVWDPVGGPVAISIAETLAAQRPVLFACPDVTAGTQLSLTGDLASASTRLLQAGVTIIRHTTLRAVRPGEAELVDRFTDEKTTLEVAAVVDCSTRLPEDALWHDSEHLAHAVGDAVAPRTIFEAVLEGRRTAIAIVEGRA